MSDRCFSVKTYKQFALCIFFFILGCMITVNLTSIERTCKLEDTDREYNIMKNSKVRSPELIILILSGPKNFHKRNTIRETWLKLKDRGHIIDDDKEKFKVKHYFVVGSLGLETQFARNVNSEQVKYNDILLLPMVDNYSNLTYKVLRSFEWLSDQYDFGLDFKYVLKCDDDSFVHLEHLIHEAVHLELLYLKSNLNLFNLIDDNTSPYLRVNIQSNDDNIKSGNLELYWGYFHGNAKIKSTGKWKENNWILCDNYLPYALGGGYILSKNLVKYLGTNAPYLRQYQSEDVSVGVWLSGVKNVLRIHDRRFDTEWMTRGCQNDYLVSHNLSEKQMYDMYKNILEQKTLCNKEQTRRPYYLYNWGVLPSQCCNKIK